MKRIVGVTILVGVVLMIDGCRVGTHVHTVLARQVHRGRVLERRVQRTLQIFGICREEA